VQDLVRVGEGYYTKPVKISLKHRLAVAAVLRQMRQVTSRMVITDGSDEDYVG